MAITHAPTNGTCQRFGLILPKQMVRLRILNAEMEQTSIWVLAMAALLCYCH
jgi:hypothetical protein